MNSGYSGTPLAKKLGIKPGGVVYLSNAPRGYAKSLEPLPDGVRFVEKASADTDMVHVFTTSKAELARLLAALRKRLAPAASIWVSWPKKTSKMPTEVGEDTIRALAFPLGLVDVKVCAVDETWSGLKLVVRKELRGASR
jgi:hypothetical protein